MSYDYQIIFNLFISGRKRPRHRTPSVSPPRRSPVKFKHERSPGIEVSRNSPHQRHGRKGHISRTPSPKSKYRKLHISGADT